MQSVATILHKYLPISRRSLFILARIYLPIGGFYLVRKMNKLDACNKEGWVKMVHLQIGKNVKKYRKEKGMSQVALAHAIGHESVGVVSTAEIGLRGKHFNIQHLATISLVLNVDIVCLFEGVDEIIAQQQVEQSV